MKRKKHRLRVILQKYCFKCETWKPLFEFYKSSITWDGKYSYCRNCNKEYYKKNYRKNQEKYKERHKKWLEKNPGKGKTYSKKFREKNPNYAKEWYEKNPEKKRNINLKNKYGIGVEEYDEMFIEQNGKCAICGTHRFELKMALCVDHNHESKEIRGLLCTNCNRILGIIESYKKDPKKWDNYLD